MFKKLFFVLPLMFLFFMVKAMSVHGEPETQAIQIQIKQLSEIDKIGTKINQANLPSPYNYLLTQPLMTKGIEKYYGRTAVIKKVFAKLDQSDNTYHRSIIMLIDSNKKRNKANKAQIKNEALIVEFAYITMNFNELPKKITEEVLNTNIPFGTLLTKYDVHVLTKGRNYFTVKCNNTLASLVHCQASDMLYGRTNTIIRADNKKWLAHVVEILPKPQATS